MATAGMPGRDRGLILTHLLYNGATKITKALTIKRIRELKPDDVDDRSWTTDAFMQKNEAKILAKRQGRDYEWSYFPKHGVTNIESWDLNQTIHILVETCELDNTLIRCMKHLQKLRNKTAHAASTFIEEGKYNHYRTKLSVIFDNCLKEIKDPDLANEIDDLYKECPAAAIRRHNQAAKEDPHEKQQRPADETTTEKLNTTIDLLHRIEPTVDAESTPIDVPECKIPLEFGNFTEEKKVELSKYIVEVFSEVIYNKYDDFQEHGNEFRHKLREAVYETGLICLGNGKAVRKNSGAECVLSEPLVVWFLWLFGITLLVFLRDIFSHYNRLFRGVAVMKSVLLKLSYIKGYLANWRHFERVFQNDRKKSASSSSKWKERFRINNTAKVVSPQTKDGKGAHTTQQ